MDKTPSSSLTMKEAVEKTNLSADTIRYYESIGIIEEISRNSGKRVFSKKNIDQILFVKRMRKAGFGITALKTYINLIKKDEKSTRTERKNILISEAQKMEKELLLREESLSFLKKKIKNYEMHEKLNESVFHEL